MASVELTLLIAFVVCSIAIAVVAVLRRRKAEREREFDRRVRAVAMMNAGKIFADSPPLTPEELAIARREILEDDRRRAREARASGLRTPAPPTPYWLRERRMGAVDAPADRGAIHQSAGGVDVALMLGAAVVAAQRDGCRREPEAEPRLDPDAGSIDSVGCGSGSPGASS